MTMLEDALVANEVKQLRAENQRLREDLATAYRSRDEAVARANRLEFDAPADPPDVPGVSAWFDGELALGKLGTLFVHRDPDRMYSWGLSLDGPLFICGDERYAEEAAARRASLRWLRAALAQATEKIGGLR